MDRTDSKLRYLPVFLFLGASVALAAATLPPSLKLSEAKARERFDGALRYGVVEPAWAKQAWRSLDEAGRVALVEATLAWARAYAGSPAFATAWAAARAEMKPEAEVAEGSVDDELAAQRAEFKEQIAQMRANLKLLPAAQRAEMEKVIKDTEAQMAAMHADPQMAAMQKQGLEMQREQAATDHAERLAQWERDYPADGRVLLRRRLQEFLKVCADVAWDAKLLPPDAAGLRKFALTAHEDKPAEWKLCYRAGRAPVEAARRIATAWLNELPAR